MRLPSVPLHMRILIGLVLGAVFGSVFHVDARLVDLELGEARGATELRMWETVVLRSPAGERSYGAHDQLPLLREVARLRAEGVRVDLVSQDASGEHLYADVRRAEKRATVATVIKPLGDVFIRLLMMIAIPLVFASLLVGVASLGSAGRMARIGGKSIVYYMSTTALAITVGLVIADVVQPGHRMDAEARDRLMTVYQGDVVTKIDEKAGVDIVDFLVNIVPKNPIAAMANGEMLPLIFFALMLGMATLAIDREKRDRIASFFDAVSDAMIRMVDMVMMIAPFAVFALISAVVGEFGFGILQTLVWYAGTVLLGLLIQTVVVYPLYLKVFARDVSLSRFFREIRPAHLVAFTTSSSAATLPVNFECCERLGAPKSITSFVLPLGATINMDGTALYQGVATLFIAQVYGMDLSIPQQLTVVLTATLASIGTAPVPGVGIIMLLIVLQSVGVPEEGIALILGIDRLLDMARTIPNITGDATAAMIVASSEGVLER
jgi:proton glutamate symport protein